MTLARIFFKNKYGGSDDRHVDRHSNTVMLFVVGSKFLWRPERWPPALAEDPGLVPSTCLAALITTVCDCSSRGPNVLLWPPRILLHALTHISKVPVYRTKMSVKILQARHSGTCLQS